MEIETRAEFGRLLNAMGLTGIAVEVGACEGHFTDEVMRDWRGKLYVMIDKWERYAGYDDLQGFTQPIFDEMYREVLRKYGGDHHYSILRMASVDAAKEFKDATLDWVYIDAFHKYSYVKDDIAAWWPRVRVGGILAGHDYNTCQGVYQAVNEFVEATGLVLHTTTEQYPSWWVVKNV